MGVLVLGAGVSGEHFVGALRRLDADVPLTVVEGHLIGGECSYYACMPSKTLLRPVEVVAEAKRAPGAAEAVTGRVAVEGIWAWRDWMVSDYDDSGQAHWLETQSAELVRGRAEVVEPGLVRVGDRELRYETLVVALGSAPVRPQIEGLDAVEAWTNREATGVREVPESLVVLGGGAVGCELAQLFVRLGSHVTLIQGPERLLPRVDPRAGEVLADAFREEGIDVRLGAHAERVEPGVRVTLNGGGVVEGERLLLATGRRPNVDGVGLERLGVSIGRGGIEVDDRLRAADGVWAVGDATGVAQFTHVGKYQARVAAANIAGGDRRADYRAIPASIFTDPQVASVGFTEGDGLAVAEIPLASVPRTYTFEREERPGFLKIAANRETRLIAGAVAVGPESGEWLQQLTLAIRAEVPVDVLLDTIQPFPTFSEAVFYALQELDL
jgi:pyruvate/2-oxoglutarate dehydrogenase complex dihydrolipoamide dehydrogenase (E3) component